MENTEQLMSLLPIFLGILIIGIIVLSGWLVWAFTRRQAVPKERPPSGAGAPMPGPHNRTPYYLLAVKPGEGKTWEIYVQGIRYANLTDVPDPKIRAAVIQAVKQAARFAGQGAITMQLSESVAPAAPGAEMRRGPSSRSSAEVTELPTRRAAPPGGLLPVIDFAQEITDIIEELQERSPALQAHAVSLQNVPSGGINFLVDGKIYADIEEIPFPEMQALIRQATQAWEAQ